MNNLLLEYCKEHHIRVTPQRMEIYEEISQMPGHPSADEIYQRIKAKLPYISMDTVYRNLNFFEKVGILSRVKSNSQQASRFEVNHEPHHHFYCEECGELFDLSWQEFDQLSLPSLKDIGQVKHSSVTLYGTCASCQTEEIRDNFVNSIK